MTFRALFSTALLSVLLLAAAPASAATVNITSADEGNMGSVLVGNEGSVDTATSGSKALGFTYDYAYGYLPSNAMITFTYDVSRSKKLDGAYAGGYESIQDDLFSAEGNTTGPASFVSNHPGLSVAASWTSPGSIAQVVITNLSAVAAYFESYFFRPGPAASNATEVETEYGVLSYRVAAVPLPAALPLFGLGLVGLAGYSRSRKKKASV